MNRRTFLELSMAGNLAPRGILSSAAQTAQSQPILENRFFRVRPDLTKGTFSVWRRDKQLLLNAHAAAHGKTTFDLSDPLYKRGASITRVNDAIGAGQQLILAANTGKEVELELRVTLYDDLDALFVEVAVRNRSSNPIPITSLEPARARMGELSALLCSADRLLSNGYIYYDPGEVQDLGFTSRRAFESFWNIALYDSESRETLVIGSIENTRADTRVSVMREPVAVWDQSIRGMSLTVTSVLNRTFELAPGESIASGKIMFHADADPFRALEQYASTYSKASAVKLNSRVNGWCSWFYSHRQITEDEVLKNAEFIARRLKPYGMTVVQIDDGYYRAFGDWEGNDRFPHGMKWLAERIRELGLTPGLWLAPYVVKKGTAVVDTHPEFLVHGLDGKPHPIQGDNTFALDVTHSDARKWLFDLFDTVANKWGYDFIKIDFVEWSLLAAPRYHDRSVSRAQAYRMGMETIRKAVGPHRHILDCGPAQNTVGLIDSERAELDLPELVWAQYSNRQNGTAAATSRRYYFHGKTWITDVDHVGLGLLTPSQAQAAATLVAMSGGTVISGDRLTDLDPERVEMLSRILPAYGVAARPLDLFRNDLARVFTIPVHRDFSDWLILAVFNYDAQSPLVETINLVEAGLDDSRSYLAFEFWSQRLLGEFQGTMTVRLNPGSVQLLSLREIRPYPQIVATSRHFTQGGQELKDQRWVEPELHATLHGEAGTSNEVFIHMPPKWRFPGDNTIYQYQLPGYAAKVLNSASGYGSERFHAQLLRLFFQFDESGERPFTVKFEQSA
jgi:melibiase-like protein